MMPKKTDFSPGALRTENKTSFFGKLVSVFHKLPHVRRGPALATLAAFIVSSAVMMFTGGKEQIRLGEFEAGRVADRDVIAPEPVSFIDEEATRIRMEAQARLVPAVFKYRLAVNDEMRKSWERFVLFSKNLFRGGISREQYLLRTRAEFPGLFNEEALAALAGDPERERSLEQGQAVLDYFVETGIFAFPPGGLSSCNPDIAELLHNYGPRVERERISYSRIVTKENLDAEFLRYLGDEGLGENFAAGAGRIIRGLLRENVFFSSEDTDQRIAEVQSHLEPVSRYIERGDRIIRRGFIITEGEMEELRALNLSLEKQDPRRTAGQILRILLIYLLLVFHMGKRTAGRILQSAECYLMTILAAAYLSGASLANNFVHLNSSVPAAVLLPTALVVMLPAILLGYPMALVTAMFLPLGAFFSEAFDAPSFFFALCSGITAAHVLRRAQKRMDLVKAGLQIAAANAAAAVIVLLLQEAAAVEYPALIFWAAFNGIASALFVIGLLPIMEQALNAVTPFRLIELSDLNAPILKRLFNSAPGTYSHSLMVANLAEAACEEIGANALLARVGAYHHDIGKMDQPDYFVENQTSYNKHTELSPRLSATVIRSHVKLGIEKARSLGLPEEIIAFIAEHHGNSVITWFYNEALKREGSGVNMEDFTYPGRPPRTKESAVVMLADVTEAAARTLKKPSAARLEKFIQELFDAKVEHGQLAQSDLTFRELQIIKRAFVKVLAGHYHSRIEYPKLAAEGGEKPHGKRTEDEQD